MGGFVSCMKMFLSCLLLSATATLAGCAAPPRAAAVDGARLHRAEGTRKSKALPLIGAHVSVDPRVASACHVPAPRFDVDSATIALEPALDQLARCFQRGPMKHRSLRLVGHADPRGGTDYNLALGKQRAEAVADYLTSRGLELFRIEVASRGAADATGTDEAGWRADRRVDLLLAD